MTERGHGLDRGLRARFTSRTSGQDNWKTITRLENGWLDGPRARSTLSLTEKLCRAKNATSGAPLRRSGGSLIQGSVLDALSFARSRERVLQAHPSARQRGAAPSKQEEGVKENAERDRDDAKEKA